MLFKTFSGLFLPGGSALSELKPKVTEDLLSLVVISCASFIVIDSY